MYSLSCAYQRDSEAVAVSIHPFITADDFRGTQNQYVAEELSRAACSTIIQNNLNVLQIRDKLHKYGIWSSTWWPPSYHKPLSKWTKYKKLLTGIVCKQWGTVNLGGKEASKESPPISLASSWAHLLLFAVVGNPSRACKDWHVA